jgi:hypothetical protein
MFGGWLPIRGATTRLWRRPSRQIVSNSEPSSSDLVLITRRSADIFFIAERRTLQGPGSSPPNLGTVLCRLAIYSWRYRPYFLPACGRWSDRRWSSHLLSPTKRPCARQAHRRLDRFPPQREWKMGVRLSSRPLALGRQLSASSYAVSQKSKRHYH